MLECNTSSEETLLTQPLVMSLTVHSHTSTYFSSERTHLQESSNSGDERGYAKPCLIYFPDWRATTSASGKRVLTTTICHVDDGLGPAVQSHHYSGYIKKTKEEEWDNANESVCLDRCTAVYSKISLKSCMILLSFIIHLVHYGRVTVAYTVYTLLESGHIATPSAGSGK